MKIQKITALALLAVSPLAVTGCSPQLIKPGTYTIQEADYEMGEYQIELHEAGRNIYVDKETFLKAVTSEKVTVSDTYAVDADGDGVADF